MDFFEDLIYDVGIYLRLSKEDGDLSSDIDKAESNSIANQRTVILNFLKKIPNVRIYKEYIDDGFTGTNFDRPAFLEMQQDILAEKVNMVVVKDLSRFGRNYVDTGKYIKKQYRTAGIRFVAILENFDSLTATPSDYNLLMPVRNFVNDQFSSDISAKVRGNQSAMRSEGLYIGSFVGYGRKKSPTDKHVILIDEYASNIILEMVNDLYHGYTVLKISERLNARGVPAPADYKRSQGIRFKTSFQTNVKSKWTPKTVIRVLMDPMNIGTMEQGKRQRINYKVRTMVEKPKEDRDIVENKVLPIMPVDVYENVMRLLLMDMRVAPGQETVYLFCGLLHCGDCERSMTRRKLSTGVHYICTAYNKNEGCTRHSISEGDLQSIVLSTIQSYIGTIVQMEKTLDYIDTLNVTEENLEHFDSEIQSKYHELERYSRMQSALYRDRADEVINDEEFLEYKQFYEMQCEKLEKSIAYQKDQIRHAVHNRKASVKWLEEFKQYKNVSKLTRAMLVILIDKVLIYENNRVEIKFRFADEFAAVQSYINTVEAYESSIGQGGF